MFTSIRRLALVTILCATAFASVSGTASANRWMSVDAPYIHDGRISGNRFIQTNAYGPRPGTVRVTLFQFYGGKWHEMAAANGSGQSKAFVYCSGRRTNYSFAARAQAWSGATNFGEEWSRVVVLAC